MPIDRPSLVFFSLIGASLCAAVILIALLVAGDVAGPRVAMNNLPPITAREDNGGAAGVEGPPGTAFSALLYLDGRLAIPLPGLRTDKISPTGSGRRGHDNAFRNRDIKAAGP